MRSVTYTLVCEGEGKWIESITVFRFEDEAVPAPVGAVESGPFCTTQELGLMVARILRNDFKAALS